MHQSQTDTYKSETAFTSGDAGCMECIETINRQGCVASYAGYCHMCPHGVKIKVGCRILSVKVVEIGEKKEADKRQRVPPYF